MAASMVDAIVGLGDGAWRMASSERMTGQGWLWLGRHPPHRESYQIVSLHHPPMLRADGLKVEGALLLRE